MVVHRVKTVYRDEKQMNGCQELGFRGKECSGYKGVGESSEMGQSCILPGMVD